MLAQELIALALIKAKVPKKRIIIVSTCVYFFFLFILLNMFHRIFHNWLITMVNFISIGAYMYADTRNVIKEINAEIELKAQ